MRQIGVCRAVKFDFLDHLSPTLIRRKFFKPFLFSVKDSNTGRSAHFVSRKSVKVAVEQLNIGFDMGSRLGTVNEDRSTYGMGFFNDDFNRVDGSQSV